MKDPHHVRLIVLTIALLLALCAFAALGIQPGAQLSSAQVRAAADTSTQLRMVVSLERRHLWVILADGDTALSAPVAVGSGRRLTVGGKTWRFTTPIGVRTVVSAEVDPVWNRPDWAYVELARERKLKLDSIGAGQPRVLRSGDSLVVRGAVIGVVQGGTWTVWPLDRDVVMDGVLYMPPLGSPYRRVASVLGKYRLNLGGAIGVHGTLDKESIGRAVTHGCMRVHDADLEWLYGHVPVGTPVFIY